MKKLIAIFLVLALLLAGCQTLLGGSQNTAGAVQTAVQQTVQQQDMMGTFIAQTMSVAAVPATAVPVIATAQPTEAPTQALPTATVVAVAAVTATANENANCRLGPAKNFDFVEVFKAGSTGDVIALNTEFGKWWQLSLADGKKCWVVDGSVTITGDQSKVAMVNSPATPTPVPPPSWNYTWSIWIEGGFTPGESSNAKLSIQFVQTGQQVTFETEVWGLTLDGQGTVSANGMSLTGTLTNGINTFTLYLVRDPSNLNQFRGKWYIPNNPEWDGAFAGFINGAGYPSPLRP